ncbi:MAG: (2Fe-2S)-binding protein [Myxococcales bacterium]|nr:(2Fe-2S)-binding protein [Myxococcales bacterium]
MIVCLCKGVSDAKIRDCASRGATTMKAVGLACRAGRGCGQCRFQIADILAEVACATGQASLDAGRNHEGRSTDHRLAQ